jgi:signal recognition particle subunit SRP68
LIFKSLQLLLYESERAWAFAQDLLAQSLLPANSARASTLRHSATGRFRRAVSWSTQLLTHALTLYSEGRFSASNLLEVHIYVLILTGRFLLRIREEPEPALEHLAVARHLLLDTLARTAQTSRDQALAVQFADEVAPEVRLCAHELGRTRAYDVDTISAELGAKHRGELVVGCEALLKRVDEEAQAEGGKRDARRLAPLIWEGEPVPVRYPELVDALLRVQDAEKKLASSSSSEGVKQGSKKSVAAYDAILLALSDAENVAHKLVEAQQVIFYTYF